MVIAMTIAGVVNLSMMIMAAALFNKGGLSGIDSIEGAFDGLQQTVSGHAATIFGVALLASGFASSSVGTMAGQVVMQGFIRRRIPIFVRRAITLAPALIVLALGRRTRRTRWCSARSCSRSASRSPSSRWC